MKSYKNIVRDILKANGIWDVEPSEESVKILSEALQSNWSKGYNDAEYDHNQSM